MNVTSLELTVTAIDEPAPGIRTFTLVAPDGAPLPGFVAGSHLLVDAGEQTNAYSLTSDGTDPTAYVVSVLRVPVVDGGSGGSQWLHERVAVGDALTIHPPRSAFAPMARARKHLLVAGGIGVTPVVSHLRAARRWGRETQVLYTFREGRAAHVGDVVELTDGAAELFTDRTSFCERLEKVLVDQPVGTHLYVCGPGPMTDHVLATAEALGWPQSRLHSERFGADALDPGEPFEVTLSGTGRTLEVPSGVSLLKALEDAGLAIPNLCRHGVCGECRIPVAAGRPLHRDLFLSEEEKQAGDALMACVSRADGPTLEVPL